MKIAVNTPTGNIGRRLVRHLLDGGDDDVVLLVRDAGKLTGLPAGRVTVHEGSLEDAAFVSAATRGVDALFWVTPPRPDGDDLHAFQNRMGQHVAAAVTDNDIARVVHVSSVGAQHSGGTGPIKGLHDVERLLGGTGASVTHLRAAFFMENYLMQAASIREHGAVFMPIAPEVRVEMIATADIAAKTARILRGKIWTGEQVVELAGPRPHTFGEAAALIGKALNHPVEHVATDPEQTRTALRSLGFRDPIIDLYLEMYDGLERGLLAFEGPVQRTGTTLTDFATEVLAPAVRHG
ncbi:MAG: NAD(P)H-binding protein [Candidatus Krumholzibacteriia bacterium]